MNNNLCRQFAFWILFFGVFFGSNTIYSQTGTVSVDFKNSSPQKIIDNLKSRTPYQFIYQKDLDLSVPLVTLKKENVSIDEVLTDLQNMTNLNFKRNENNIAVNSKDSAKKKRKGKITGKVVDVNGLSLPGVNIKVSELNLGTQSDIDGNYVLELEPGEYTIELSAISFQTQKITAVKVSEGSETPLVISLKEDTQSLKEVVIVQDYKKATASVQGLLLQQKKAAQFSDGISAEQIARTPDRDVASSLKRITGVTTIDNKYVVVRSMGERWNQAVMDGITLPSTDAYKQNFSFDIIPTAMVESIVVSKSATPDMYANFAGGYVEIKTKDIPKENFTTFSISSSYNSRSTFKERITKQEGDYDYLGFDDGRRNYPTNLVGMPLPTSEANAGPFVEQSKKFTEDNFTSYKTYAAPGSTLQFALGRAYELKDNTKIGFVGSLFFKNTQEKQDIEHTQRAGNADNSVFVPEGQDIAYSTLTKYGFRNSGANYNYNSTLGGMFNAAVQFGNHKITTRNMVMHIYNNQLTQITGWSDSESISDILNGTILPSTRESNYPVYQTIVQNKVEGSHKFEKLDINWYGAYSTISKDTKDATFIDAYRKKVGDDVLLYHYVYNSESIFPFSRSNFTNDEVDYNFGLNLNYSFDFSDSFTNDIKAGYFGTYKKATNQQESAKMVVLGSTDRAEIYEPLSQFLDGSNYYYGGFGWQDYGVYGNKYVGDVKVHSPFLMLDNKIGRFVRLAWGVRAESYIYTQIQSQSEKAGDFGIEQKDDKLWQFLPSVSLIISPTKKMNVRLGYNKSVLRPQFAERLSIPYFDPVQSARIYNYSGGMISSVASNYDVKLEWFPSGGEILSFGIYHKDIDDPIEAVGNLNPSRIRNIYNLNSYNAKLWGVELEFYKSLSFLGEGPILEKLFISGNASINDTKVTSYVQIDGDGGLYEANRPLYGQSPYTYNLGLDYIGERMGFSVRHNAIGDQYVLVGFDYQSEEIRMPYSVTDAQVSYKFFKERNLELKCSMKNIFDTGIETYDNSNSYTHIEGAPVGSNPREVYSLGANATKRYDEDIDKVLFKAKSGRTISLSINYSF